jgi:hypothetical protein
MKSVLVVGLPLPTPMGLQLATPWGLGVAYEPPHWCWDCLRAHPQFPIVSHPDHPHTGLGVVACPTPYGLGVVALLIATYLLFFLKIIYYFNMMLQKC